MPWNIMQPLKLFVKLDFNNRKKKRCLKWKFKLKVGKQNCTLDINNVKMYICIERYLKEIN